MLSPSDSGVRGLRSPRSIHLQMLLLERQAGASRDRVNPPVLGGDNPTLRDLLFRAGAAWLIGWATLLSVITWARL
ncbi:MAG: hypothetical protein WAT66_06670 [Actinomycetota bacterium]